MFTLLSHISTCNICINFIIPTQRINSNFLGSVSSGGSGFAFPFPFPFLTRVLLRGTLAGLFCFSWDGTAVVVVLAIAPAGWPSNNRKKKSNINFYYASNLIISVASFCVWVIWHNLCVLIYVFACEVCFFSSKNWYHQAENSPLVFSHFLHLINSLSVDTCWLLWGFTSHLCRLLLSADEFEAFANASF